MNRFQQFAAPLWFAIFANQLPVNVVHTFVLNHICPADYFHSPGAHRVNWTETVLRLNSYYYYEYIHSQPHVCVRPYVSYALLLNRQHSSMLNECATFFGSTTSMCVVCTFTNSASKKKHAAFSHGARYSTRYAVMCVKIDFESNERHEQKRLLKTTLYADSQMHRTSTWKYFRSIFRLSSVPFPIAKRNIILMGILIVRSQ